MTPLAAVVVRWWPAVLVAWAVAVVAAVAFTPSFAEVAAFDDAAFLPGDSPASRGQELVMEGWPDDTSTRSATVVLVREGGPLQPRDEAFAADLVDWLSSPRAPAAFGAVTTHLREPDLEAALTSEDGQAMMIPVGLDLPPYRPEAREAVAALQDHLGQRSRPEGLVAHVTGAAAVAADENEAIEATIERTQVLTVVLVVALLVWVFRSALAPLVPLATVGSAYLVARGIVGLLAQAGLDVSYLFEAFAIVIVFGAGTDYSLLIMSRYGEELGVAERAGHAVSRRLRRRVVAATMAVLGGVMASSAASTVVGFSTLSLAEFGLYRTLGPALAVTVALTLLAGLTITPALVRLLGPALFWPNRLTWGVPGTGVPLVDRRDVAGHEPAAGGPAVDRRDVAGHGPSQPQASRSTGPETP